MFLLLLLVVVVVVVVVDDVVILMAVSYRSCNIVMSFCESGSPYQAQPLQVMQQPVAGASNFL